MSDPSLAARQYAASLPSDEKPYALAVIAKLEAGHEPGDPQPPHLVRPARASAIRARIRAFGL